MTISWPQTVAIIMLAMEVGYGLRLGSRKPPGNGWTRIGDAIFWGGVMWWGGFFN